MKTEIELYELGMSIPEVHQATGIPLSTLRYRFAKAGVLRSRSDGVRRAAKKGKLGGGNRGKSVEFSQSHKDNISAARLAWGDRNAKGISLKPNGYVEYTRGKHKGRSVHVVSMEKRIGRRLRPDECVHHIDQNRSNNNDNNLALMTKSGHARHHRMMEGIEKNGR
jgi:hypothetical protein